MIAHICKDAVRSYEGYIDFCIFKEYNHLYFEEQAQYLVTAGLRDSLDIGFIYFQRFLFFKNEFTAFSLAAGVRSIEAAEGWRRYGKQGAWSERVSLDPYSFISSFLDGLIPGAEGFQDGPLVLCNSLPLQHEGRE